MGSLQIASNWKYKYVDDNKVHLFLRIDIITSHHKAPVITLLSKIFWT